MHRVSIFSVFILVAVLVSYSTAAGNDPSLLIRPVPPGHYRIACEKLRADDVASKDDKLAEFASAFVTRPDGDYGATSIDYELNPIRENDVLANVTFFYTDVDPMYSETVAVQIVDMEAPTLINLPQQGNGGIIRSTECQRTAVDVAMNEIAVRYLPHVYAIDACSNKTGITYSFSVILDECRNRGRVAVHWSADDMRGNSGGVTQIISFYNTIPPGLTEKARIFKRDRGIDWGICVFGAQRTPVCPVQLFRNMVTHHVVKDECDSEPSLFKAQVKSVEYRTCTSEFGRSKRLKCTVVERNAQPDAVASYRTYQAGTYLEASMRVQNPCQLEYAGDITTSIYFVDSRQACEQLNLEPVDAREITLNNANICF